MEGNEQEIYYLYCGSFFPSPLEQHLGEILKFPFQLATDLLLRIHIRY